MARSLEQRWEQALRDQRQVEEDRDRCLRAQPPRLTADERARITALASDVPLLWRDARTTAADRQAVIRHLVERVVVTVQAQTEYADVRIHWAGGYVSEHEVMRPVRRYDQLRTLSARGPDRRIAGGRAGRVRDRRASQPRGISTAEGRATFTAAMVRQLLSRRGLSARIAVVRRPASRSAP